MKIHKLEVDELPRCEHGWVIDKNFYCPHGCTGYSVRFKGTNRKTSRSGRIKRNTYTPTLAQSMVFKHSDPEVINEHGVFIQRITSAGTQDARRTSEGQASDSGGPRVDRAIHKISGASDCKQTNLPAPQRVNPLDALFKPQIRQASRRIQSAPRTGKYEATNTAAGSTTPKLFRVRDNPDTAIPRAGDTANGPSTQSNYNTVETERMYLGSRLISDTPGPATITMTTLCKDTKCGHVFGEHYNSSGSNLLPLWLSVFRSKVKGEYGN